jgi:predicted nucleic acid-binding protein
VDTSVFIAAVTAREPDHHGARTFLEACTRSAVLVNVPVIWLAEFGGGLSRTGRKPNQARRFVTRFRDLDNLDVAPITLELGEAAAGIALMQRIRGCDSIYIALARSLTVPLVTLDREQQTRAPADVEVITPEQALAKWWASRMISPTS